jgi:hypothetical protein
MHASLLHCPTIIHLKVNRNIINKYEQSYKWKVQHGVSQSTMKLSKTCMVVMSYHCCSILEFLNVNA